jgi:hypothetical protein
MKIAPYSPGSLLGFFFNNGLDHIKYGGAGLPSTKELFMRIPVEKFLLTRNL